MEDILKAVLIMVGFIALTSLFMAVFAFIVWNLFLSKVFEFNLGYHHWFGIIFIVNILKFDVVEKLNNMSTIRKNNIELYGKEEEFYNEN